MVVVMGIMMVMVVIAVVVIVAVLITYGCITKYSQNLILQNNTHLLSHSFCRRGI